jgi:integrase
MTDIRKRNGSKGVTYQVRFASKSVKSGYAYKTFDTLKEARYYAQTELPKHTSARHDTIKSVEHAVQRWLDTCEHEGRQGKDPISKSTFVNYKYRADIMRKYSWEKELHELEAPDIVAFRSWLLKNYSRDVAQKVLSAFHSALLEMVTQGILSTDPASNIAIQQSRYKEPVRIPSVEEMQTILRAADDLANDKNYWIARAWKRYRPMIYLAADTGMRPQEYLVMPIAGVLQNGVRITQALDGSNEIGPPKSRAGRRFIPVGLDTLKMVMDYQEKHDGPNSSKLLFPGEKGHHQTYNNFLRRGWYKLMEKAGMMVEKEVKGKKVTEALYTPYSLRHFFASMLISQNKDIKTIQEWMGHQDAAMTLNVYGHLIRLKNAEQNTEPTGILSGILQKPVEHGKN